MSFDILRTLKTEHQKVVIPKLENGQVSLKINTSELPPLPKLDFNSDSMYVFRDHLWKCMFEAEEMLIKTILKTYLKRHPEISDAKRCTKIEHVEFPGKYILAYDHVQLGMVIQEMQGFVFHPGETTFY